MTFATLNAAVADLRNVLTTFAGQEALLAINVRPPKGDAEEASFLRLVAWSYAVGFEAGRVAVPYLTRLPGKNPATAKTAAECLELVRALRTWSFHNLGFANDSDLAISRRVHLWFQGVCAANPPETGEEWKACFERLCGDMLTLTAHCKNAMETLVAADAGGGDATADLRRRIERMWAAHRFDEIVNDVAARLGISVDGRKFREPRLSGWREYVGVIPEGNDLDGHVVRLIERDLLDYAANVLPVDGRDIMSVLGLEPGPQVADMLRRARELQQAGVRDPKALLERLSEESGQ